MHKSSSDLKCNQNEMVVADPQDIHFIVSLRTDGSSHTKAALPICPGTVPVLRDAIKWTLVVVRKCKLNVIVRLFIDIVITMTAI